jgi:hypothetical protein
MHVLPFDVLADLLGRFLDLDVRDAEPGELLVGVSQLTTGRPVEFQDTGPRGIEYDDAVRREFEEKAIAGFGGPQPLLALFTRLVLRLQVVQDRIRGGRGRRFGGLVVLGAPLMVPALPRRAPPYPSLAAMS